MIRPVRAQEDLNSLQSPIQAKEHHPITCKPRPSSTSRRWLIVAAFWMGVVCGVPYWWYTTRIERLSLPTADIQAWVLKKSCFSSPSFSTVLDGSSHSDTSGSPIHSLEAQGIAGQSLYSRAPELTNISPELNSGVVKYASNYRVVISLLNEDATHGQFISDWNVEGLVELWLTPLLNSLAPVHTFDVETEIQYFAPLSISVHQTDSNSSFIDVDDLKAFVNSAEWRTPSSSPSSPVLHLMIYVPSPHHRPLLMRDGEGSVNPSNAFLIPQRGGVFIFNPPNMDIEGAQEKLQLSDADFSVPFRFVAQQLRLLLGVPLGRVSSEGALEQWQIDFLVRARLIQASSESIETLKVIVDLVRNIPNMRVGKEVQRDVTMALEELSKAAERQFESPEAALRHAANAMDLSSNAYFNPSMLALLYFPDEHKYAVYTPLFGPVAVPLLVALIKEIRDWRIKKRKARDLRGKKVKTL